MFWRKFTLILMIAALSLSLLAGCKSGEEESAALDSFVEEDPSVPQEDSAPEQETPEQEEPSQKEEPPVTEQETPAPEQKPAEQPQETPPKEEQEETPAPEEPPAEQPEEETEESEEPKEETAGGPFYTAEENPYKDSLKILAIGNSFSIDGMEYLWDIADSYGVKNIVLGNLYIGGCTLDTHYSNMTQNAPAYKYYKNTSGNWGTTPDVAISTALKDEKWDIITIQQESGSNRDDDTFDNLPNIIKYVEQRKPKKDTKILWHMTWTYQSDSTKTAFTYYGRDQMKMYDCIVERVENNVLEEESIVGVIPVGTAIQNLRGTTVGDTLTRDGYHLSKGLGRFTAALTWYCYITGADPEEVLFTPFEEQSKILQHFDEVVQSVKNAIATPFEVTEDQK